MIMVSPVDPPGDCQWEGLDRDVEDHPVSHPSGPRQHVTGCQGKQGRVTLANFDKRKQVTESGF